MSDVRIPDTHRDLVDGCAVVVLTTLMPNGQPQMTPVWWNREGDFLCINTMRGFQKEKNMRANPRVTLLAYDPACPLHYLEVRGEVVEMTEVGALQHLDQLTAKYLNRPNARFFGDSIPAEHEGKFTPVKIRIAPTRIRAEG